LKIHKFEVFLFLVISEPFQEQENGNRDGRSDWTRQECSEHKVDDEEANDVP